MGVSCRKSGGLPASAFLIVDSGQEGLCYSGWGTQIPWNLPNGMIFNQIFPFARLRSVTSLLGESQT